MNLLVKHFETSEDVTKTMMYASKESNKALENLKDKILEIMKDRGILASYLLSPLSIIRNHELTSQYKLLKEPQSNRVNDRLINKTVPVTLCDN